MPTASVSRSPAPASPDPGQLTEVVSRLRRALRASVRTDFAWEALPMAQVELLQTLAEHQPARVGDLAARLHLANSTVSGLVSALLAADLIERGVDASDRRAAVVSLSGQGYEQLAAWGRAHERRIGVALERLGPEERAAIAGALAALGQLAICLAEDSV